MRSVCVVSAIESVESLNALHMIVVYYAAQQQYYHRSWWTFIITLQGVYWVVRNFDATLLKQQKILMLVIDLYWYLSPYDVNVAMLRVMKLFAVVWELFDSASVHRNNRGWKGSKKWCFYAILRVVMHRNERDKPENIVLKSINEFKSMIILQAKKKKNKKIIFFAECVLVQLKLPA